MPRFDAAYLDPNDPRLICGTPQAQKQKLREFRRQTETRAIMTSVEREIPRADLIFGRWVEVESTGELFHPWGGDPWLAPEGAAYYVDETGFPRMLEPADPPNRAELVKRQARKEQRRLEREAASKERRRKLIEGAR